MTLAADLDRALAESGRGLDDVAAAPAAGERDELLALLSIYDLHQAPLAELGERARLQHHPAVAAVKSRLEAAWLDRLARLEADLGPAATPLRAPTPRDTVAALRAIAARNRLPEAYRWLARSAGWDELIRFLALEGGPDGGFDDLVALCQLGLRGAPKLELARNYWDEMGRGEAPGVHTTLHERMASALGLPRLPRGELPVPALERAALGGLLSTNRWLQPELVGALGLIELQAGPRCRLVLQAFDRLGAPADAYPFYVEHAEVDPRHGRDWLDHAVTPLVAEQPGWAPRVVRGAWWRATVNLRFFDCVHHGLGALPAAA